MTKFPVAQILLLTGAVLAVSVASILTEGVMLPTLLVGLAVLAIIALGVIDRHRETRLFPTGTFSWRSPLAGLFAMMLLLNLAIICDMFVPLFIQNLHGQSPLVAGYMVALVAVGWSSGSVVTSSWAGSRAQAVIVIGPVLQAIAIAGLALFLGRDNTAGAWLPLVPVGVSLVLLGTGIGISWPHISARLLQSAPAGEGDLTSASISMVQLFAAGLGAAVAGVIVNAAGLAGREDTAATIAASNWLYGLFALVPLVTIPIAWRMVRGERLMLMAAAEPAE